MFALPSPDETSYAARNAAVPGVSAINGRRSRTGECGWSAKTIPNHPVTHVEMRAEVLVRKRPRPMVPGAAVVDAVMLWSVW